MPAAELVEKLRAGPSTSEVDKVLQDLIQYDLSSPNSELLAVFTTLLLDTLPNFSTRLQSFVKVFSSPVGLQCLCSRLRISDLTNVEVGTLLDLMQLVLAQSHFAQTLYQSSPREARQLLWGSRILASASVHGNGTRWFADSTQYTSWLAQSMVEEETSGNTLFSGELLERTSKLGAPEAAVKPFLVSLESLKIFRQMSRDLRPPARRFILVHGLLPLLSGDAGAASGILVFIEADPLVICDAAVGLNTINLLRATVVLARETGKLGELCSHAIRNWADRTNMWRLQQSQQRAWAQICVGCAINMSTEVVRAFNTSLAFVEGVGAHLESSSDGIRQLGTLVAEIFAKKAGEKLEFGLRYEGEWFLGVDSCSEVTESLGRVNGTNSQPISAPTVDSKLASVLNPPSPEKADRIAPGEDSDDEEDEKPAPEPFYIKDLIEYLATDESAKIQSALLHGSSLVRRKAAIGFTGEVAQHARTLLKSTAILTDKFSLDQFAERRQALLTATLAVVPSESVYMVELLVQGDWSLSQRISLLATMALAAHELAQDTVESTKGLNLLPTASHRAFLSEIDRLGQDLEQKLVVDASNAVAHSDGRITRTSVGLSAKKSQMLSAQRRNRFAPIAHTFFFPLAVAFVESHDSLVGQVPGTSGYTAVVRAQWLKTLGYILWCAYPSASRLSDMASELVQILIAEERELNQEKHQNHEVVTEEAIFTCCLYLANIHPGTQWLLEMAELYAWAGARWQQVPDERIKRLGAAVVVRLSELLSEPGSQASWK